MCKYSNEMIRRFKALEFKYFTIGLECGECGECDLNTTLYMQY